MDHSDYGISDPDDSTGPTDTNASSMFTISSNPPTPYFLSPRPTPTEEVMAQSSPSKSRVSP
jgi:hypothetical protein